MGACIPNCVFEVFGYLVTHQSQIQSLSIITDGRCRYAEDEECPINISHFRCLRSLSWRGVRNSDDFKTIRDCLSLNAPHLRELTLDLVDWYKAICNWSAAHRAWMTENFSNFFTTDVLKIKAGDLNRTFPVLDVLSLSAVSFETAVEEIPHVMNFAGLSTLKLRHCRHVKELLERFPNSRQKISLTSFEVVVDSEDVDFVYEFEIGGFLSAFQGLQNLYLMTPDDGSWPSLLKGVLNHETTLKRLVIHARTTDDNQPSFDEATDGELPRHDDLRLFPGISNLECLGIYQSFLFMVSPRLFLFYLYFSTTVKSTQKAYTCFFFSPGSQSEPTSSKAGI